MARTLILGSYDAAFLLLPACLNLRYCPNLGRVHPIVLRFPERPEPLNVET